MHSGTVRWRLQPLGALSLLSFRRGQALRLHKAARLRTLKVLFCNSQFHAYPLNQWGARLFFPCLAALFGLADEVLYQGEYTRSMSLRYVTEITYVMMLLSHTATTCPPSSVICSCSLSHSRRRENKFHVFLTPLQNSCCCMMSKPALP
jgi:hypothetical protein